MKADFKCSRCACDVLEDLQFDHIIPVWNDGPSTLENGQALCEDCHAQKSTKDRSAYRKHLKVKLVEA